MLFVCCWIWFAKILRFLHLCSWWILVYSFLVISLVLITEYCWLYKMSWEVFSYVVYRIGIIPSWMFLSFYQCSLEFSLWEKFKLMNLIFVINIYSYLGYILLLEWTLIIVQKMYPYHLNYQMCCRKVVIIVLLSVEYVRMFPLSLSVLVICVILLLFFAWVEVY